jgi:hypothetical protein
MYLMGESNLSPSFVRSFVRSSFSFAGGEGRRRRRRPIIIINIIRRSQPVQLTCCLGKLKFKKKK